MLESIDFDKNIRIDRSCGESGRNSVDCIEYDTSLLSQIKLADLILQYSIDRIYYASSLGQWNERWSSGFPISSFPPSGSYLVIDTSNSTITTTSTWSAFLRELSSLLGGSFGANEFSRSEPYILPSISQHRIRYSIGQHFSRDFASAESLTKWQRLLAIYNQSSADRSLNREYLHSAAWYAFTLHVHHTQTSLHSSEISLQSTIFSYHSSDNVIHDIETIARDEVEIYRYITNNNQGGLLGEYTFSVQSLIQNTQNQSISLFITESTPYQYRIDHESYSYCLNTCNLTSTISGFKVLPSIISATDKKYGSISYPIVLKPFENISLSFTAHRVLMNIAFYPPDSSYGLLLPPLIVQQTQSIGGKEFFFSQPILITTAIPDMSMPYTVYTLVSTLMAFMLGSLLNIFVKQWKGPLS